MTRLILVAILWWGVGCAPAPPRSPLTEKVGFSVSASSFRDHPELAARVARSPQDYFRFVNAPFVRRVCAAFEGDDLPEVILHGDAHVGQFAITEVGYGLDDFDAGGVGPPVIDLVRFATSIVLGCRRRGWEEAERDLVEVFLDRYLYALRESKAAEPRPAFVTEQIEAFPSGREAFLRFVAQNQEPVKGAELEEIRAAFGRYVETVRDRAPAPGFFEVQSVGRFHLGIGSALDRKYLWRVRGATESPADDVVLEMHEVAPLPPGSCMRGGGEHPADRILRSADSLGRIADPWRGRVPMLDSSETPYRVHTWRAHFHEVAVTDEGFDLADFRTLVLVAGEQLGSGQVGRSSSRLQSQRVAAAVEPLRSRIIDLSLELADEVHAGWERFRSELSGH